MSRFLVTPEEMNIDVATTIVGDPPEKWHGRCFEVASMLAEHMKHAFAVYGHYLGSVNPKGFWGDRAGHSFQQHGWVGFKRRKQVVLDPTRFSFEGVEPYIYLGPADHYDVGGNTLRGILSPPCPPFDFTQQRIFLKEVTPSSPITRHIEALIPECRMEMCMIITVPQALWLANVHYARLEPFAKEIYTALEEAGCGAFVPIDNMLRASR